VHPTKIEVRFYNANLLHSQILGCLREKLLGTDLDVEAKLPEATERSQNIREAMTDFFQKHRPVHTQQQFGFRKPSTASSGHEQSGTAPYTRPQIPLSQSPSQFFEHRKFLQIHNNYILPHSAEGFMIIDQHALHERIMYEDLSRRIRQNKLESQKLLIPESFEVTEAQTQAVEENTDLLEKLGIELVPFGPKTMAVQGFPTLLAKAQPLDFIRDFLDLITDAEVSLDADRLLDEVLHMAACKAACKAGQKLSDSEIEQLLETKEVTESSSRCPHGRPTTIKFSIADLEKQFKRT
jgi:DNA mismatch repair protein MutL